MVETELLLSDLQTVEHRLRSARNKQDATLPVGRSFLATFDSRMRQILEKCREGLDAGAMICLLPWSPEEKELVQRLQLLTSKPFVLVCNTDSAGSNKMVDAVKVRAHGWPP